MWKGRVITTSVVVGIAAVFVALLYQPWLSQWGSTAAERGQAMPGDGFVAGARSWTRSITIDAPPDRVWPWLVQMGVDKGGFYTYDWGEQLFGDPVHNAIEINPEWQDLRAGDEVHPFPVGPGWVAEIVEPNRVLVLTGDQGRWSWALELRPEPGDDTRLVTRMNSRPALLGRVLDPADLIVIPRLLTGVKQRAEGTLPGMPGTDVGAPFPTARLPAQWWAAGAWLCGLALFAALTRRRFALGHWGQVRRHPLMVAGIAFVAGAGYLLMSDTPPVQFFTRVWVWGAVLAIASGVLLGRWVGRDVPVPTQGAQSVRRLVAAFTEAGLFVVIPVTVVWQAATRLDLTSSTAGRLAAGALAAAGATAVAAVAWRRAGRRRSWAVGAVFAIGYALTGSGLVPLLGAVVLELIAGRLGARADREPALDVPRPPRPAHVNNGGRP